MPFSYSILPSEGQVNTLFSLHMLEYRQRVLQVGMGTETSIDDRKPGRPFGSVTHFWMLLCVIRGAGHWKKENTEEVTLTSGS